MKKLAALVLTGLMLALASSALAAGKTLVVYYSATGTTERAARTIAQTVGADIFKVEPARPYTDADLDWNDSNSRTVREHNDESLRNVELVSTTVPNWNEYDTVLIGYPIWWGIAAWPVDTFVKANDFTGKRVITFATAYSSGMGSSTSILQRMAGTGRWEDGRRFRPRDSERDIASWANSLGLAQ